MENLFYYTVFTVLEEIWYNVSTYSSTMNIRGSEMHACMHLRARMFMSRAPGYEQTQPRSGGKRGSAGLRMDAGRTRTDHICNGIKKEGEV